MTLNKLRMSTITVILTTTGIFLVYLADWCYPQQECVCRRSYNVKAQMITLAEHHMTSDWLVVTIT